MPQEAVYYMGQPLKLRGCIVRDQRFENILQIKSVVLAIRDNLKQYLTNLAKITKEVEAQIESLVILSN